MAFKITDAGRTHLGQRLAQNFAGSTTSPALTDGFTYIEIGTGTKGTLAASANIVTNGAVAAGASTLSLKDSANTSLTGTLLAGDVLQFAGDEILYIVTAAATASGNAISVGITPALQSAKAGTEAITVSMGGLPSDDNSTVRTPLPGSTGLLPFDAGYPQVQYVTAGPQIVYQVTFPAGTFDGSKTITEAAITNSSRARCFARGAITAKTPGSAEPLTVTLTVPLSASTVA